MDDYDTDFGSDYRGVFIRVMAGDGMTLELVDVEFLSSETRVIDEIDLWALRFESGLRPSSPDEALITAIGGRR